MRRVFCLIALVGAMLPWNGGARSAGLSSPNVEYLGTLPFVIDGVGGRLVDNYFYASDQNKIMIFDVSIPELPILVGATPLPQEFIFNREDIDTNGEILIYPDIGGGLLVYDVTIKSLPLLMGRAALGGDHTNSCILGCTWSYGSDGTIVDLRNPAAPVRRPERWGAGLPANNGHDVEEIAPGIVLTATQPIMLLDVADPLRPVLLATGSNADHRFIHTTRWAREGADKIMLASGETNFVPACHSRTGAFMTWDASSWRDTETFTMLDEFRVDNGNYVDGSPPFNVVGCSSHWFEPHPKFNDGGVVAAAFFEHGTRFLDVAADGQITEVGYFMPFGRSTGAAYWITDEIVYATNYGFGIDILRYREAGPQD